MTKASDNEYPRLQLTTGVATTAPTGGLWELRARADGLYAVSSNTGSAGVGPFAAAAGAAGSLVDVEIATCSGALTMSDAAADVTGATLSITPSVAEIWKVTAIFDFRWTTASAGQTALGLVDYDGSDQTPLAMLLGTSLIRATVAQVHRIAATAASHTIKLQAYKTTSGGVCEAQTNSQIIVERFVAP